MDEDLIIKEFKDVAAWFTADLYNRYYVLLRDDDIVDLKIIHQKDWTVNKTRIMLQDYICGKGRLIAVEYVHNKTNFKSEHFKFIVEDTSGNKHNYNLYRCNTEIMEV